MRCALSTSPTSVRVQKTQAHEELENFFRIQGMASAWADIQPVLHVLMNAPRVYRGDVDFGATQKTLGHWVLPGHIRTSERCNLGSALHLSQAHTVHAACETHWYFLRQAVACFAREAQKEHEGVWGYNVSDLAFFLVAFALIGDRRLEMYKRDCLVLAYVEGMVCDLRKGTISDIRLCGLINEG